MDREQSRIRRLAGLVSTLVVMTAGTSQALTYTTGDVVAVFFGKNATELLVDLGQLSSLTNGKQFTFGTPSNFGATGALGGQFAAFQTQLPTTGGMGQNATFTTALGVNPTSFDNNSSYVTGITAAQVSIDDGFGGGFSPNLNNFPATGMGGVIFNSNPPMENSLAIPSSTSSSYTNTLGLGTNQINGSLPFSIADNLTANGHVMDLWTATVTGALGDGSLTSLDGTLTVDGNSAGDGSKVRLTFNTVPEPGTFVLVVVGLSGLARMGSRIGRRAAM